MKIIFFGSGKVGVPSLKALIKSGHEILCAVTQPDKEKGRHLHIEGTAVKEVALEAGIMVFQPKDIKSSESLKQLQSFEADLFVIIAYGQILSQEVLDIPKIFCINAHTSLLPKYRGASPIARAIMEGEKETGVTIIKVERKMDAGPVILSKKIKIDETDTFVTLELKLSEVAQDALSEAIKRIEINDYKLFSQDESMATPAPKLRKSDGCIDWRLPAQEIYNLIRALIAWPGAFTYYKGKLIKIYNAKVESPRFDLSKCKPGEILEIKKNGILVACREKALLITELQPEAKRIMGAQEFIAGHKIVPGDIFKK
jgi:methionyl-tRNA formyltransferase